MNYRSVSIAIKDLREDLRALRRRLRSTIYTREPNVHVLEDLQHQISEVKTILRAHGLNVRPSKYER